MQIYVLQPANAVIAIETKIYAEPAGDREIMILLLLSIKATRKVLSDS